MKNNLGLGASDREPLISRTAERRAATLPSDQFLKATRSTLVRTDIRVNGESIDPGTEPPRTRA